MRKLPKEMQKEKELIWQKFSVAAEEVESSLSTLYATYKKLMEEVKEKVRIYNEVAAEAEAFRDKVADEIRQFINLKIDEDERWEERPKSTVYDAWLTEWEEAERSFDPLDVDLEEPDELDLDLEGPAVLEELSNEIEL